MGQAEPQRLTPRLLTAADAAAYLATTERHLRDLAHRGDIPVTKVGRLNRFDRQRLDRWIERHTRS